MIDLEGGAVHRYTSVCDSTVAKMYRCRLCAAFVVASGLGLSNSSELYLRYS